MIGYIRGRVIETQQGSVLVDVGGIGYLVELPQTTFDSLPAMGEEIELYTQLIIRDDKISLYGFPDSKTLKVFKVLIEVSGVGPKLAMNVLSVLAPDELISDIAKGDTTRIKSVHGVGKKTAARICVDLKEKASKLLEQAGFGTGSKRVAPKTDVHGDLADDAVSALVNLGYKSQEAKRAVSSVIQEQGPLDINQLIKEALQVLAKVK
ncbi:MAG: Holliday junction branch migration protein RuvA [Thermodesulfobacteria bacterium]|nr:Holliday junction branch migration protein RuvA [Thermodesulfobacteriota bacterium]